MSEQSWKLIAKISAPAKIILCGEHAVVYGQDAISMAINLKCYGEVYTSNHSKIDDPILSIEILEEANWFKYQYNQRVFELFRNKAKDFINFESFKQILANQQQFKSITQHYNIVFHFKVTIFLLKFCSTPLLSDHIKIVIKSDIPIGKCLGSSASFNTVFAAALLVSFKQKSNDKQLINSISFCFEEVQHGNPSGIDNYVTVYGGLILFNKNKIPKFQRLNEEYSHKIKQHLFIGIADSCIPKNTKIAVTQVRQKCQSQQKYRKMIKEIGNISKDCIEIIKSEKANWKLLIFEKLKENHEYLKEFNLSNQQIEKIIQKFTIEGVSCSKITGSGMGGCVLIIGDKNAKIDDPQLILTEINENGVMIDLLN